MQLSRGGICTRVQQHMGQGARLLGRTQRVAHCLVVEMWLTHMRPPLNCLHTPQNMGLAAGAREGISMRAFSDLSSDSCMFSIFWAKFSWRMHARASSSGTKRCGYTGSLCDRRVAVLVLVLVGRLQVITTAPARSRRDDSAPVLHPCGYREPLLAAEPALWRVQLAGQSRTAYRRGSGQPGWLRCQNSFELER